MASEPEPNEWSIDFEIDPVYAWRIEQLEHAGFDHFPAFRIAMNDCDWRKAIRMLKEGCPQDQILEILL